MLCLEPHQMVLKFRNISRLPILLNKSRSFSLDHSLYFILGSKMLFRVQDRKSERKDGNQLSGQTEETSSQFPHKDTEWHMFILSQMELILDQCQSG